LRDELIAAHSALFAAAKHAYSSQVQAEQLARQLQDIQQDADSRTAALIKARDEVRQMLERRSAAKSRFIAEAAHDLRQPMQAMGDLLQASWLSFESGNLVVAQDCLADAMRAVADLRTSFNMVLDLSVLESGGVAPTYSNFDIRMMIEEVIRTTIPDGANRFACNGFTRACRHRNDERDVEISIWHRGRCIPVYSDRRLLRRVLTNLVSNSIKYSDPSKPNGCRVLISAVRLRQYVRLEVADNGIGIPAGQTQNVFEPYTQLHNPNRDRSRGVGLGLSVVRAAIELLQEHRIEVRSVEGKGSRFSVELPLGRGPIDSESDAAVEAATPSSDLSSLYAVLIENDSLVLKGWEALLSGHGAMFESVHSLDELKTCLASIERHPDVILTDYRLPNGATAADINRVARDVLDANVPMVILTGELSDVGALEELRSARVLRKPIPSARLIDELLAAAQGSR
jgi:signal transduction histidine kinase/CheY-like chemotaxis protein